MVRRAMELRRHFDRLAAEQSDLLSSQANEAIRSASRNLKIALAAAADGATVQASVDELLGVAEQRLLPFPHAGLRENIKEFFVAATVILAITTFFVQLTKIPTGSMQPTLYGITHEDLRGHPTEEIPSRLIRFWKYWTEGISYIHETATGDGELRIEPPRQFLPFIKRQRLFVGEVAHTVWFPPERLEERAGLVEGKFIHRGEDILKLRVITGDHLLVDRITYNFRRPARGEIFVFKTRGIIGLAHQDQLYIKRLVALSNEHVRIGDDQHLVIDGKRLDAATPHFENVYTFSSPPRPGEYFGHVNQTVANRFGRAYLAENFLTATNEFVVGPGRFLAMGDNTLNSHDSRAWGDLPCENVIGKCWFVYWPFTHRFGWGNR